MFILSSRGPSRRWRSWADLMCLCNDDRWAKAFPHPFGHLWLRFPSWTASIWDSRWPLLSKRFPHISQRKRRWLDELVGARETAGRVWFWLDCIEEISVGVARFGDWDPDAPTPGPNPTTGGQSSTSVQNRDLGLGSWLVWGHETSGVLERCLEDLGLCPLWIGITEMFEVLLPLKYGKSRPVRRLYWKAYQWGCRKLFLWGFVGLNLKSMFLLFEMFQLQINNVSDIQW